MSARSELEIIQLYRENGDMSLIGELYQRYSHLVYSVAFKYLKDENDCNDVVMDIFEKLVTDLKKYSISYFSSWLYISTKNHCLMVLKQNKRFELVPLESMGNENTYMEFAEKDHLTDMQLLESKEQDLKDALLKLNDEQRNCLELFYLKELSYQQIVEQTKLNYNQVKSYIQNGKRNLKLVLTRDTN